ncbi:fimbrial protein [Gibbsiella dentisursi]|uniref:Fimbrial protein n=1 Tax=Gibbsiella dentisursi TaxID=796890 RepID=A0ABP7LXP2_9GAMM
MLKFLAMIAGFLFCALYQAPVYSAAVARAATVTVSGTIADTTCSINSDNTDANGDMTVILPSINTAEAITSGVGTVGEPTEFSFTVSDCDPSGVWGTAATTTIGTNAATFYLTIDSNNASANGDYIQNSGTAEGIGISLKNETGNAITLGQAFTSNNKSVFEASNSEAVCKLLNTVGIKCGIALYAYYYNYGGSSISAGSVIATATYTINWE